MKKCLGVLRTRKPSMCSCGNASKIHYWGEKLGVQNQVQNREHSVPPFIPKMGRPKHKEALGKHKTVGKQGRRARVGVRHVLWFLNQVSVFSKQPTLLWDKHWTKEIRFQPLCSPQCSLQPVCHCLLPGLLQRQGFGLETLTHTIAHVLMVWTILGVEKEFKSHVRSCSCVPVSTALLFLKQQCSNWAHRTQGFCYRAHGHREFKRINPKCYFPDLICLEMWLWSKCQDNSPFPFPLLHKKCIGTAG